MCHLVDINPLFFITSINCFHFALALLPLTIKVNDLSRVSLFLKNYITFFIIIETCVTRH